MSKQVFMICNAHLDPVWQWEWEEGAAEAISTFRVAADFCEEYEGFIFNHNEALLYRWVEEYEPELFERIKVLVKKRTLAYNGRMVFAARLQYTVRRKLCTPNT